MSRPSLTSRLPHPGKPVPIPAQIHSFDLPVCPVIRHRLLLHSFVLITEPGPIPAKLCSFDPLSASPAQSRHSIPSLTVRPVLIPAQHHVSSTLSVGPVPSRCSTASLTVRPVPIPVQCHVTSSLSVSPVPSRVSTASLAMRPVLIPVQCHVTSSLPASPVKCRCSHRDIYGPLPCGPHYTNVSPVRSRQSSATTASPPRPTSAPDLSFFTACTRSPPSRALSCGSFTASFVAIHRHQHTTQHHSPDTIAWNPVYLAQCREYEVGGATSTCNVHPLPLANRRQSFDPTPLSTSRQPNLVKSRPPAVDPGPQPSLPFDHQPSTSGSNPHRRSSARSPPPTPDLSHQPPTSAAFRHRRRPMPLRACRKHRTTRRCTNACAPLTQTVHTSCTNPSTQTAMPTPHTGTRPSHFTEHHLRLLAAHASQRGGVLDHSANSVTHLHRPSPDSSFRSTVTSAQSSWHSVRAYTGTARHASIFRTLTSAQSSWHSSSGLLSGLHWYCQARFPI